MIHLRICITIAHYGQINANCYEVLYVIVVFREIDYYTIVTASFLITLWIVFQCFLLLNV